METSKIKKYILYLLIAIMTVMSIFFPFIVSADTGFDYVNYTELEYIQSSGTQYINTGLNGYHEFELKFKLNSIPSAQTGIFGSRQNSGSNRFGCMSYSGLFHFMISTTAMWNISLDTNIHILHMTTNILYDNGTEYSVVSGATSAAGNSPFYLSATYNVSAKSAQNIYYAKFYDSNGDLLKHFVPARRNSDNVVGMYETVNGVFYVNDGTGVFTAGPVVSQTYTVSTSVSPSGSGSVNGGGLYQAGSTATLTAVPASGYVFDHWSDNSTNNPLSILVNSNVSVTAYFVQQSAPVQYTVSTSVSPSGTGSVLGGGTYDSGTSVSLQAYPQTGYVFDHWSNGSTANPLSFTLSDNVSYTAYFVEEQQTTSYNVSITVDPALGGSVSGAGVYVSGNSATLTATPSTNYTFDGWYLGNVKQSSSLTYSFLVDQNYSFTAKFTYVPPQSDWIDWTDTNDVRSLADVSASYQNKIGLSIIKYIVIDQYVNRLTGLSFNANYGDLAIVGTYSNNQFQSINACNSTSISQTNTDISPTENITIRPWVSGTLNAPGFGSLNYGIEVVDQNLGSTQATQSTVSNTTQACRVIGYNSGDSGIDASMWDTLGYHAVTTYSDVQGNQATVYMPDDQDIELSLDLADFMNHLSAYAQNITIAVYHYEYDVHINVPDGYILPEYGMLKTSVPIQGILNAESLGTNSYMTDLKGRYTLLSDSSGFNSKTSNMSYTINDGIYDNNEVSFYWQNEKDPHWEFRSAQTKSTIATLYNNVDNDNVILSDYVALDIRSYMNFGNNHSLMYYTVQSSDVSLNNYLTAGVKLPVNGFSSVKIYEIHDNSILNRFNQLGAFLNNWFSRIYNSIANITGGSESNDITNNIINDNSVDVDLDLNLTIDDLKDKDSDIDLTLPDFTISSESQNNLELLSDIPKETIKVFTDNKLGFLIFVPIVIAILRLIL